MTESVILRLINELESLRRKVERLTADIAHPTPAATTVPDHDHSGDVGDGDQFDADHLTSTGAALGDVLTADGAGNSSFQPLPAAGAHEILSATHSDTTVSVPNDHDVLTYDQATGKWIAHAAGAGSGDVTWAQIQASQIINEIKHWPCYVGEGIDLDAKNLWWDKIGTPTTAPTTTLVSGEGITETYHRCMKVVSDAANEGLQQTWTYTDEPRVKSGRKLSTIWAIWCVGGLGVTLKLVNSDASETAAAKVTAAAWTIVTVENHTLAGTSCDVRLITDGAGTFYAIPLGANIGEKAYPLPPRPLRHIDAAGTFVVNDADSGAAFTDCDLTAQVGNLGMMVYLTGQLTINAGGKYVSVRRNGDTIAYGLASSMGMSFTSSYYLHVTGIVLLDDAQIFEWQGSDVAGNTEHVWLVLRSYWVWG